VSDEMVSNLHTDFEESGGDPAPRDNTRDTGIERNGSLERASSPLSPSLPRNRLPPHDAHNTRKGSDALVGCET
jgi:hypothetical protein